MLAVADLSQNEPGGRTGLPGLHAGSAREAAAAGRGAGGRRVAVFESRQRLRHSDILTRWGGEEFMILATETALSQAIVLAETLRAALRQSPFPDVGPVTASFGVAQYRPDETVDQWLKRVDDLVYQVKRGGRDQISHRR